ncbi:hypothetical protein [Leptolyngbya sp. NM2-A1]|uniref:hypothetical protein n=1 Tax=unclassified Leptolyngbya TaxID=2650499 RepID=UPI0032981475
MPSDEVLSGYEIALVLPYYRFSNSGTRCVILAVPAIAHPSTIHIQLWLRLPILSTPDSQYSGQFF